MASIEYDRNRSARIALLRYVDGEKRYILAPLGLNVGDKLISGPQRRVRVGNALPLRAIPLGTQIHNIELQLGRGGVMVRSAGVSAQLMAKEGDYATLRMPSGEMRRRLSIAWRRSARSAISITRILGSARPGVSAGWAGGPRCAAR